MLGIVKGPYFFQRTLDDWATKQIRDIQAALCRGVMEHGTQHQTIPIPLYFRLDVDSTPTHPDTKFSSKHKILYTFQFYLVWCFHTYFTMFVGKVLIQCM